MEQALWPSMLHTEHAPRGPLRLLLRLPVWLYRLRLGWLLGRRFLLLTHTGRQTGKAHDTVIEVMRQDVDTGAVMVAAAWGDRADWFRNLQAHPEAKITIGAKTWAARAEVLPVEGGAQELYVYATDHPTAFHEIMRLVTGERVEGTMPECQRLAERIPVVAFVPVRLNAEEDKTE